MLSSPLIKISDACFPRESPPWTLGREIAFLLAGKGAYAQREIGGVLASPATGPLSSLYASALFRYLNPEWSRRFARLGLYRTDVRFLRRDFEWLLSPECVARAPLIEAAQMLRGSSEEELRLLSSLLTSDEDQTQAVMAALLRQADPQQSLEAALPGMLEALWEAVFKEHVERLLQVLSQEGQIRNAGLAPPSDPSACVSRRFPYEVRLP
jgi:hypothetical protein